MKRDKDWPIILATAGGILIMAIAVTYVIDRVDKYCPTCIPLEAE